ncbi:Phosphoribosylglycinamide formyltransferase [Lentilactobacillus parabuchneri]|jgi:phosphoribosylglycinamide formyltransferase-1|uniref:Phosphoribosylglycinamide formyltransferase n=2 Tax=Lentilactobacillus parabuchneri TaxID=152331 RepID=A0A1X1FGQ0_9LACO|nr:phosphoribosylglycinamide formyltransferase [Lentilactobacillus parabuchneri]APR06802.1 Phosphoribosylglycinamide formyltransferase [Lentilactobacillus parabuchneri]KRM46885.1 phosphoribosylglycinamide formyltransferase [Lentilactobacillus parabuchneri DSM 5707 = NBRC 107865]KRN78201.1 phosphoribosylglycinamide formyltransferase [Lentilactobacillus parabuchneri]MBW0222584.1 phosphoribosylglycinamide formyltransferase [Lentilactobacillus parabuchneri]MBW0245828.1 phosphoribosylglycinamide fo
MKPDVKNIAIFASGEGTNFTALTDFFKKESLPLKVKLLVCDHAHVHVLDRAHQESVPTFVINFKDYPDKAAAETVIAQKLADNQIDFIILAGYMRIIGPTLLAKYEGKIINIHPALLPKFPGRHGIEDAYEAGVDTTGVTVHWVDSGIDSGKIIAQQEVPVHKDDQLSDLEQRIHATEHVLYPNVVKQLLERGEI